MMLKLPNYARDDKGGHGGLVSYGSPHSRAYDEARDGPFDPDSVTRSDAKMITRAIEGRWPIAPETRERLIRTLSHVIDNPDIFGARIVVNAAQALLNADKLNMEQEARDAGVKKPVAIEANGRPRLDFSKFTDEELEQYLEGGGRG